MPQAERELGSVCGLQAHKTAVLEAHTTTASLNFRLKDLLRPVTRVQEKK